MGAKPVNFVAWLDAARYVNWLHNGKPTGAQGNTTTEQGAYDLTVANPGVNATRQAGSALVPPDARRMERRGVHRSGRCLVLHLSDAEQHGADDRDRQYDGCDRQSGHQRRELQLGRGLERAERQRDDGRQRRTAQRQRLRNVRSGRERRRVDADLRIHDEQARRPRGHLRLRLHGAPAGDHPRPDQHDRGDHLGFRVAGPSTCADADGDGWGTLFAPGCRGGDTTKDCDDTRASVYPGAPQICDGRNNDCSDPSWPTVPAAEADSDADGVPACADNCPTVANASQTNIDGDSSGDACDTDDDGDGVLDTADNCPTVANANQANLDGDSLGRRLRHRRRRRRGSRYADNCPRNANANQANSDGDALGNVCDTCPNDAANDADARHGVRQLDNCPTVANTNQANSDGDALGNACDTCPNDAANDGRRHGVRQRRQLPDGRQHQPGELRR